MQTETATGIGELDAVPAFTEGVKMLKNGYPKKAVAFFKRALECDKQNAFYLSLLGVSIWRAERNLNEAVKLCEAAIQRNRREVQFHMNLADIYAAAGLRDSALHTLDKALASLGEDKRLRNARNKVQKRRTPVFPFLDRGNILNRELGKLRHRVLKDRKD